jgi:hypothetical protein
MQAMATIVIKKKPLGTADAPGKPMAQSIKLVEGVPGHDNPGQIGQATLPQTDPLNCNDNTEASPAPSGGAPHELPTVTSTFGEGWDFPHDLASTPFTGSKDQLLAITVYVAAMMAKDFLIGNEKPTASKIAARAKATANEWWDYLTTEIEGGPEASDKSLRAAIATRVKDTFDSVAHKFLSGHDLPPTDDGYLHNPIQLLREATGHGDAALFLYRIRYWWPKASIWLDGKKWIAKTHKQWADELGMKVRSFRTAYQRSVKLGLVEAHTAKFNGVPMLHIRPTEAAEKLMA